MWKTWSPNVQGFLRSVYLRRVNRSLSQAKKTKIQKDLDDGKHESDEVSKSFCVLFWKKQTNKIFVCGHYIWLDFQKQNLFEEEK